jgi:hypothetical protein
VLTGPFFKYSALKPVEAATSNFLDRRLIKNNAHPLISNADFMLSTDIRMISSGSLDLERALDTLISVS